MDRIMNYELYFWRLAGNSNRYKRSIQVPGLNEKLGTLYDDVFGSQARTQFSSYCEKLEIVENETRFISEDSINTHFFNDYYIPPKSIRVSNTQAKKNISYEKFYRRLIDGNDTDSSSSERIGSNRISFLTGAIGDGKTTLMSKVVYDISVSSKKIIPIYISIEEEWIKTDRDGSKKPKSIDEEFYSKLLLEKIRKIMSSDNRLPDYCGDLQDLDTESAIGKLLTTIRQEGYSIVLMFDDLDRYHFYYDKYSLFDDSGECYKSLDEIVELYNRFAKFDKSKPLSCLGISVVFVLRDYVYSMIHEREGLNPRGGDNLCYEIERPNYKEVVNSRLNLLVDAIDTLDNSGDFWVGVRDNVLEVKSSISSIRDRSVMKFSDSTNLEKIFLLSHHGCRSIIDFMKGLKIFGTQERKSVMKRYLSEDHSAIVILYLLNHKYLYTQNNNHFPNLYLINAHITSGIEVRDLYPEAIEKHRHSYWLKYLILAYLKSCDEDGCTVGELLAIFCEQGNYSSGIVKLAIGSLATPNWFACINIDYESVNLDMKSRKVSLTNRGSFILGEDKSGEEFCFTFSYLQLVIDDYLLHMPKALEKYRIENDYSYLYEGVGAYGDGFVKLVKEKYPRVIMFVRILECSFNAEMTRDSKLHEYLLEEGVSLPNFASIYKGVRSSIHGLLGDKRAQTLLGDTSVIINEVKSEDELLKFFTEKYLNAPPVMVGS
jgi:hypothetical protein